MIIKCTGSVDQQHNILNYDFQWSPDYLLHVDEVSSKAMQLGSCLKITETRSSVFLVYLWGVCRMALTDTSRSSKKNGDAQMLTNHSILGICSRNTCNICLFRSNYTKSTNYIRQLWKELFCDACVHLEAMQSEELVLLVDGWSSRYHITSRLHVVNGTPIQRRDSASLIKRLFRVSFAHDTRSQTIGEVDAIIYLLFVLYC
jgi:hypothetical protein